MKVEITTPLAERSRPDQINVKNNNKLKIAPILKSGEAKTTVCIDSLNSSKLFPTRTV